ncbi:MAG: hypothetical protein AB7D06_13615 [Pedobacter sp.]
MKKILVLTVALMLVASGSFAFELLSTTGVDGKLGFGDSVGTDNILYTDGIGLSPKVVAKYATDGTDAVTAQWYSIATVHPGGNMAYGTAQNVNNIFSKSYTTGDETATVLDTIPVSKASESEWTTNEWNL